MKHTPIARARERHPTQGTEWLTLSPLCGPVGENYAMRGDSRPPGCDRCSLLASVLEANVHPFWLASRPFRVGNSTLQQPHGLSSLTRAARFYALRLVGSEPTEDSDGLHFKRWSERGTFERISKLIEGATWQNVGGEMAGAPSVMDQQQVGCHFCGSSPLRRAQQAPGRGACGVCGSHEVTWPDVDPRPHEADCEWPTYACECDGEVPYLRNPPMRPRPKIFAEGTGQLTPEGAAAFDRLLALVKP